MPSTFTFEVGAFGRTSGAIYRAVDPAGAILVLAHGAGAPRTHPFMTDMAKRIAEKGVDVATFNFLYAEAKKKMPDRVELLEATWRAAIATVRARSGLPSERLFIGGKSMGGRMATHVAAEKEGLTIAGVVLFGYPLHPLGKPRVRRDEILKVDLPTLVVQGTRDELGTAKEMKSVVSKLAFGELHVVEGGDHSLQLLARDGAGAQEHALDAAAAAVVSFITRGKRKRARRSPGGRP